MDQNSGPVPAHIPRPAESARLAGLDALRGIAALWVLHYHVMRLADAPLIAAGKGYLAVDFFFMLSGYVMARTYEHRFAQGFGPVRFMAARYRRLWPVMAIGASLGAPLLATELQDPGAFALIATANLFLIPVFLGSGAVFPLNSPAWSIFAELCANLAHALGLWRLRTASLAIFCACLLPALIWTGVAFESLNAGAGENSLLAGVLRSLFAYGVGVVLWRVWRDTNGPPIPPALAFALIPALALAIHLLRIDGWPFDIGFVVLASPLLIAGGLAYRGDHWLARGLGSISFPLYAVHLPILFWSQGLGFGLLPGVAAAFALAAGIAMRGASLAGSSRAGTGGRGVTPGEQTFGPVVAPRNG